jgi:hypothetical protein
VNVLANDFLGAPPATISDDTFEPGGGCTGFSFDPVMGVFSGTGTTPFALCGFQYILENSAGRSVNFVIVEVAPLSAPNAFFDVEQATAGEPFSLNVLTFDELGHPPATITSHTFTSVGGCSGLSFDEATGLLSGTPIVGVCDFDYVISNVAGSDSAGVTVTFFAGPTAPVARPDTRQVTAGQRLIVGVLTNDSLGHPQATITSHTFDAGAPGCVGLSFDPTIGLLIVPAEASAGVSCAFDYTLSNDAGSSTTSVQVVTVAAGAAPATTSSTSTTTPPTTSSSTTSTTPTTATAPSTTSSATSSATTPPTTPSATTTTATSSDTTTATPPTTPSATTTASTSSDTTTATPPTTPSATSTTSTSSDTTTTTTVTL